MPKGKYTYRKLGQVMRGHRISLEMTLEDVRVASGLTPSQLTGREIGRYATTTRQFWWWCNALGLTTDDVLRSVYGSVKPPSGVTL